MKPYLLFIISFFVSSQAFAQNMESIILFDDFYRSPIAVGNNRNVHFLFENKFENYGQRFISRNISIRTSNYSALSISKKVVHDLNLARITKYLDTTYNNDSDMSCKTDVGFYLGIMFPHSGDNSISPSIGVTVAPSIIKHFKLPFDLAFFRQNHVSKVKTITRLSLSLQYDTFQISNFNYFIKGGLTLEFTEEPLKFNFSTGINFKHMFLEGKVLLWRESGDNATILIYSPLIINIGYFI